MNLVGKRILVVEDEMLIALDTMDELKNQGCVVLGPALRLEPGLAMAREKPMDAAVLDVNLAGKLVWPLAGLLLEKHIPFVFVTGFGSSLEFPPAFASVPRLDKPIQPGALAWALALLLS